MIAKGKKAHDAFFSVVIREESNWNDLDQWQRDAWAECESTIAKDALTCPRCHFIVIENCGNCGEDMY